MKRSHGEMSAHSAEPHSEKPGKAKSDPRQHQPKISRKIRACQECQSRKIKCGIEPGEPSCARCQRLSLRCIVNKSLQTLLEDESEWKTMMESKTHQLQSAVSEILRQLNLPSLDSHTPSSQSPSGIHGELNIENSKYGTDASPQSRHAHAPPMNMTRENSIEPPEPEDGPDNETLVAAPMASLFEVTKLRNLRQNLQTRVNVHNRTALQDDFVSRGKVSLRDAEELFHTFDVSLNHYLWGGIALLHDNLTSLRESSSLLLAAILAVTALHVPGREDIFDVAYTEFLELVSESMFDRYHNLDDVRAFCIGAFWLSDVSWKLSGHAVRIATELGLHHSFSKALRGHSEHIERARLWYFLYVCDHHFSIAYGRPPVIHEDTSIACHETFLQCPGISQADWRLHSQVGIFRILSRIYLHFGPDSGKPLSEDDFDAVRGYNADLDAWRTRWEPRLAPNKYISTYPARGVIMHWNFGKLQLNALALRGLSPHQAHLISEQRREFANLAIANAANNLQFILEDPSIRTSVIGVPLYLHTMITCAAVFLLKVQLRWKSARLSVDLSITLNLIERVIEMLSMAKASDRHITYHIARGLSKMLHKFKKIERIPPSSNPSILNPNLTPINSTNGMVNVTAGTPLSAMNGTVGAPPPQQEDWAAIDSGSEHGGMFGPGSTGSAGSGTGGVMDMYAFDQEYFQMGVFDALTLQMPG